MGNVVACSCACPVSSRPCPLTISTALVRSLSPLLSFSVPSSTRRAHVGRANALGPACRRQAAKAPGSLEGRVRVGCWHHARTAHRVAVREARVLQNVGAGLQMCAHLVRAGREQSSGTKIVGSQTKQVGEGIMRVRRASHPL